MSRRAVADLSSALASTLNMRYVDDLRPNLMPAAGEELSRPLQVPAAVTVLQDLGCAGTTAYIGLPEREATKLQDLWRRDEVGVGLSVEVKAPVVVGIYPMRIARFVIDQTSGFSGNGQGWVNGHGWAAPGIRRRAADGDTARGARPRRSGQRS